MAGYAQAIAEDVIAQMATLGESEQWAVPYVAAYKPGYLASREELPAAGDPNCKMQVIIASVQIKTERTGWGGGRITVALGIMFRVGLLVVNGECVDQKLPDYELFVDEVCTWLAGPRKFATYWDSGPATAIYGDDFQDYLQDMQFHVPVQATFFWDRGIA